MLEFRLARPARLLVTVYGPGPSCARLATFARRGHSGVNRLIFSGSLYGRPLAPGRYAIVLEAVRAGKRTLIGRVLVVVLARDGREGGNRSLAAPDCTGGRSVEAFVASVGSGVGRFVDPPAANGKAASDVSGGVAGVSAAGGDRGGEGGGVGDVLPNLPALPELPALVTSDDLDVPGWALMAIGVLAAFAAAAAIGGAIRRRREYAAWD